MPAGELPRAGQEAALLTRGRCAEDCGGLARQRARRRQGGAEAGRFEIPKGRPLIGDSRPRRAGAESEEVVKAGRAPRGPSWRARALSKPARCAAGEGGPSTPG
eukprot:3359609-Pyramimonas_sp.AAC.1